MHLTCIYWWPSKGQALHHEQMHTILTTLHVEGIFTIFTEKYLWPIDHCVLIFDCHLYWLIITLIVFNDQTKAKLFPLLEIQRKYGPIISVWRYKLRILGKLTSSFKKYFCHLFSNTEASSCGTWPLKGKYSRTFLQNKLSGVV